MSQRHRVQDSRTSTSGTYYNKYLGEVTRTRDVGSYKECDDTVGQFNQDNGLLIYESDVRRIQASGSYNDYWGNPYKRCTNYPAVSQLAPLSPPSFFESLNDANLLNELATAVAAGTNPSVAHVSVPSFIGELADVVMVGNTAGSAIKWGAGFRPWRFDNFRNLLNLAPRKVRLGELPYLVWSRGIAILQAIAAGNITWRFGIAPMVGDLTKLINFTKAVEIRMRMLAQLQVEGSIRRRMMLGYTKTPEVRVHANYCVESSSYTCFVDRIARATESLWATARWHLDADAVLPQTVPGQLEKALALTYGITKFELLVAMWELTPWSWFVDWFARIQEWLDACNNSLPVHLDGMCLMQHCTSRTRYETVSMSSWIDTDSVSDAYETASTKKRIPLPWILAYIPSLPSMPALTGGQLSIVGSLATLKMGRWNLRNAFRGIL